MITQQHWIWQCGKNLGQDTIWVVQNIGKTLCKTQLVLAQLLQPVIHSSYAEFHLQIILATKYNSCVQSAAEPTPWREKTACHCSGQAALVSDTALGSLKLPYTLAEFFLKSKEESTLIKQESCNWSPCEKWSRRSLNLWKAKWIECPAHCQAAPCHPSQPAVMCLEISKLSAFMCREALRKVSLAQHQYWRQGNTQSNNKNITHLPREGWIT